MAVRSLPRAWAVSSGVAGFSRLRPIFFPSPADGTFVFRNGLSPCRHARSESFGGNNQMTRLSRNSYSIPTDIAAVERLLSELEPRLERLSSLASRTSSDIVGM